jgi:DNA repair exonuclease SbcCD ATPase subunit
MTTEEKLKELEEKFSTLKDEIKQLQTNDNLLLEIDKIFKEALKSIALEIRDRINNEVKMSTNMLEMSKILEQILDRERELKQIIDKLSQRRAIAEA